MYTECVHEPRPKLAPHAIIICDGCVYLNNSVNIVTRLRAGQPGFDSRQGQDIFLLATASGPTLGPTQPPIERVSAVLSPPPPGGGVAGGV
jgi:hypothetical protein